MNGDDLRCGGAAITHEVHGFARIERNVTVLMQVTHLVFEVGERDRFETIGRTISAVADLVVDEDGQQLLFRGERHRYRETYNGSNAQDASKPSRFAAKGIS